MSENRTRIKICGITNLEDAQAAIAYGADALGFILFPDTPRYVGGDTKALDKLLACVPPFVQCVGVCPDPVPLSGQRFDAAQFYEVAAEPHPAWFGEFKLILACRVRDESSLATIYQTLQKMCLINGECLIDALLLDTYHQDKLGGSGETFNWQLAAEAKARFELPLILAGGLTPENVGKAVRAVRPYAVDVSSGVEASPGRKDHAKIKAFIDAVRAADAAMP